MGAGDRAHLTFSTLGDYHDTWERVDRTRRLRHRHEHSHAVLGSFDVFAFGDGSHGPGSPA